MRTPYRGFAIFALASLLSTHMGGAQELGTVQERQRPDYDAVGARFGGFLVFPAIELVERYDDNIFAEDSNEQSDFITIVSPRLTIESDWSNHALGAQAGGDLGFYADSEDENYADYFAAVNGRLDASRATQILGEAGIARHHEDRGSPDDVQGAEPTEFTDYGIQAGVDYQRARVALGLEGSLDVLDFEDVSAATMGTINNDDRDRAVGELTGQAGYEIIPDYLASVRAGANWREYDDAIDDNGFNRDSDGYFVQIGSDFRLSGVTSGQVFIGYAAQNYDDGALPDVDGVVLSGDLVWNVTALTTIRLEGSRSLEETTLIGASAYFLTSTRLLVDHELLRNLILSADFGYGQRDYQGISRDDDVFNGGIEALYLVNRNLRLGLRYNHTNQSSSVAGEDYERSAITLRVRVQF